MALAFVAAGCVNEKGLYTPPAAETGAQVYIPNAKTSYAVRTAEEKQEAKKELSKIVKTAPKTLATPEDDKVVSIPIARKNTNGDYECTVVLTLPKGAEELFNVTSISYKLDGQDKEDTEIVVDPADGVLSVTFTFPDEVDKVGLNIGFDIAELVSNTDYKFNLTLGEDCEISSYGTPSLDFTLVHPAPVHNPWVVIGECELVDQFYEIYGFTLNPHTVSIAIHENDFAKFEVDENGKWKSDPATWELKDQQYYRFCIPAAGYQFMAACVEAGEMTLEDLELTEDEFEEYFGSAFGLMFTLDKSYNSVWDYDNAKYPHMLSENFTGAGEYYLYHMAGYDHSTGTMDFYDVAGTFWGESIIYDGYISQHSALPYYLSSATPYMAQLVNGHVGYDFSLQGLQYVGGGLSIYGLGFNFNWTKNGLIEDWENYFKVDYNPLLLDEYCEPVGGGDINYENAIAGSLNSEIKGTTANANLYMGHDDLYGDNVYWLNYGVDEDSFPIGIALLENGSSVKVADHQFIGTNYNGKDLFFSQSDKEASTIERNADGAITKVTFKLVAKTEDESSIFYYTEEFIPKSLYPIGSILGDWTMNTISIYGETEEAVKNPAPYINDESATITIVQVEGNDVRIEGILSPYEEDGVPAKAYITGTFNPDNGAIEVEPQFFKYADGKGGIKTATIDGMYLFFQPGVTDWSCEDYSKQYGIFVTSSYLYSEEDFAAFNFNPEDHTFVLGNSLKANNTSYPVDGFAVELYEYDTTTASHEYAYDLYCTIGGVSLERALAPGMPSKKAREMHRLVNGREFAAKAPKHNAPAKVEFSIFNK